jgi:hypothetical protein
MKNVVKSTIDGDMYLCFSFPHATWRAVWILICTSTIIILDQEMEHSPLAP